MYGSGAVSCSCSLLIRGPNLARCQAEAPLIALCRFSKPALTSLRYCMYPIMTVIRHQSLISRYIGTYGPMCDIAVNSVRLPTAISRAGFDINNYDALVMDTQGSE